MPRIEFEYCALHYLNLWLGTDRKYCEAMQSGSRKERLEAMTKFAADYRIARNLPRKFDVGQRYKPVLNVIDKATRNHFKGADLIRSIKRIRKQISKRYGDREVLSATTKFLWLKIKSPIIIYDGRARRALETDAGQLEQFYSKWHQQFDHFNSRIESACDSLPKVHKYARDTEIATRKYIAEIASHRWFKERVFDVYLWHVGDLPQSERPTR